MGYEEPIIKIISIKEEDVITTSGHGWEFQYEKDTNNNGVNNGNIFCGMQFKQTTLTKQNHNPNQ